MMDQRRFPRCLLAAVAAATFSGCRHGQVVDLAERYELAGLDAVLMCNNAEQDPKCHMFPLDKKSASRLQRSLKQARLVGTEVVKTPLYNNAGFKRFYRAGKPTGPWFTEFSAPPHGPVPPPVFLRVRDGAVHGEFFHETFTAALRQALKSSSFVEYEPGPEERIPGMILLLGMKTPRASRDAAPE